VRDRETDEQTTNEQNADPAN